MDCAKIKKDEPLVAIPPPPPRFTLNEWYLNHRLTSRKCLDQQQLADMVLQEADRLADEIDDITRLKKKDVDNSLDQRITDMKFISSELNFIKKDLVVMVQTVDFLKERIFDAQRHLDDGKNITLRCITARDGRVGIDLVCDDVEKELLKELEVIQGVEAMYNKVLEQCDEQLRRMRSAIYFIDRDLEDKENVLKIDGNNLVINETSMNLSMYHGFTPLNLGNITLQEWEQVSAKSIENAMKEINLSKQLGTFLDTVLKQGAEDLQSQADTVNLVLQRRISEISDAKTKLEVQHSEICRQANEMTRKITKLEKAIAAKEGFMALNHTRLGNRAQRPGIELCSDKVETFLIDETDTLRKNVARLQHMLAEAQASLRYLLKTQIQLEEEINIKTNSLKIDEVDCLTSRQSLNYRAY